MKILKNTFWIVPLILVSFGFFNFLDKANAVSLDEIERYKKDNYIISPDVEKSEEQLNKYILNKEKEQKRLRRASVDWYRITGYQALRAQTDSTPHLAAWNDNIRGAINVAAVVQDSPLRRGTCIKIDGLDEIYIVLDRFNKKYNGSKKIDVLVKTKQEAHRITGRKKIKIMPRGSCGLKRVVNGKIRVEKFSRRTRFKL